MMIKGRLKSRGAVSYETQKCRRQVGSTQFCDRVAWKLAGLEMNDGNMI